MLFELWDDTAASFQKPPACSREESSRFDIVGIQAVRDGQRGQPACPRFSLRHERARLLPDALEEFTKRYKFFLVSRESLLIWEQTDDSPLIDQGVAP